MIQNISLEKVLFLDIETVPNAGSWEDLSETEQKLWDKKLDIKEKTRSLQKIFMTEPVSWQSLEKLSALRSECSKKTRL